MLGDWCYDCANLYGGNKHWSCFYGHKITKEFRKPAECKQFELNMGSKNV